MYKDYFRLNEMPFSIAPDPRFLFMSDRHREALAHLLYGVQGEGGIVLLTGDVGTGKTTVCRSLLEHIPDNIDIAFILNPRMNVAELLQTVCEEFRIAVPPAGGTKVFVDAIHARLLEANADNRRAVLIVDEAQNLEPQVLEQLRLLTNLETNTRKLLQIILIGQPELQDLLGRPDLRQVAQRVVARYHLTHLRLHETAAYIAHRLRISGAPPTIFPESLVRPVFRATGGVPRLINLVCDRALLGTYVQGRQQVSASTLAQAVGEVLATRKPRWRQMVLAFAVVAFAAAGVSLAALVTGATAGWTLPWQQAASDTAGSKPAVTPPLPMPAATPQPVPEALDATTTTVVAPVATEGGNRPTAEALPTGSLEWPAAVPPGDSQALAFETLLQRYGLPFDKRRKGDPCHQAEMLGMRCYAARGGFSDLLLLDQPVVLKLVPPGGAAYSVAVLALGDHIATVVFAGEERRVAFKDLAGLWSGRYTLVWKPPAGFIDSISAGQHGAAVNWLRQSLAHIDGEPDNGEMAFDEPLARRVRAFQLTEGIQPDGVVGPVTAIRLNARSGQGGPRLTMNEGKKG